MTDFGAESYLPMYLTHLYDPERNTACAYDRERNRASALHREGENTWSRQRHLLHPPPSPVVDSAGLAERRDLERGFPASGAQFAWPARKMAA